jgi:large subunit ribosomal protein L23
MANSLPGKSAYDIIVAPHITERTVSLSLGDPRIKNDDDLVRKYTFIVAKDSNKIEIKAALEQIYNEGRKDPITITNVATIAVKGKKRRRGQRTGYEPDRKKAIVTLAKGQILEDYGV